MNQKISELIRRSEVSISHLRAYHGHIDIEKFAQLIVGECIAKIEEAAEHSPELYGVALDLQEHFGIE